MQKMLDIENWKKHLVQRWKDELGTYNESHRNRYTHELYPVTFYENLYMYCHILSSQIKIYAYHAMYEGSPMMSQ